MPERPTRNVATSGIHENEAWGCHERVHDHHAHRPAAGDVFTAITDVARTPVWTPGLTEAHQTSQGPLRPGTTLVYAGTFLGRRYTSPVVCTGLTPGKRFATKTAAGPFYLEVEVTLEPSADGTRVINTCRGESRGFFKLAEPLVVRLTRKQTEAAFDNLRMLLEEEAL
jgi:hypothetical protein